MAWPSNSRTPCEERAQRKSRHGCEHSPRTLLISFRFFRLLTPSRREGRVIGIHLYAAVRFPCATFSRSGPRLPAGTRPSLRPLGQEGEATKQSSGETRRENAKACLQLKMRPENWRCRLILRHCERSEAIQSAA